MERPALFSDLSFEAARTAANSEGKLLLVDVTSETCPPCRHMDKTTWSAAEVEKWVSENAVAVQLDRQDPALKSFKIRGVPTLLLIRDGTLLGRVTGACNPEELLDWLDRAQRGDRENQLRPKPEPTDIQGRVARAEELLEQGSFDQACQELAWCWEHALEVDPALAGVKYSYLLRDIKELMAEYAPARAVFVEIRDRTEQRLPESDALQDWLHLNQALGDEDRSLAWLDRSKADPAFSSLLEERRHVFTLFELLERHDRWADLGALIRDPTEFFRAEHKWLDEIRRQADLLENAEGIFAYIENNFR
ncbi:MAG TPA: thioredoxin fold domain-containing protein, partial [Polyangiaceae bacterium]